MAADELLGFLASRANDSINPHLINDVQKLGNHTIEPAERTAIEITVVSSTFLTLNDHAIIKIDKQIKTVLFVLMSLFN